MSTKKGKAKPKRKYDYICVGEDDCVNAGGNECMVGAKKGNRCCLPRLRGG